MRQSKGKPVRDINCIFLFALGGQPHQDMWDVKPDAPSEIRGDFNPISTKASGIQISDVLPRISTITDKLAIMRSVTHVDSDHGRGYHVMMTGKRPGAGDFNGNQNNNPPPCLGSMVAKLGERGALPLLLVEVRGDRKREPDIHSRAISFDGCVEEPVDLGEGSALVEF